MKTFFESISRLGAGAASILFVLAGAMLTFEVVARYFFVKPTIWAAELSQMCLIWGSLLAMAWLLANRQHIQVDAVIKLLPQRVARWIDVLVMLVVAVFAATVMWFGFEIFYDSFLRSRTTGSLLNIPIWIVELAVPVGFALLLVQSIIEILTIVTSGASPLRDHAGVDSDRDANGDTVS